MLVALTGIVLCMGALGANAQSATVENPSTIPLVHSKSRGAPDGSRASIIVVVTGYQPPREGAVDVVVKAQVGKEEREIGRFGIIPLTSVGQVGATQRFRLFVPSSVDVSGLEKLKVYVLPMQGDGAGARVDIKSAKIE